MNYGTPHQVLEIVPWCFDAQSMCIQHSALGWSMLHDNCRQLSKFFCLQWKEFQVHLNLLNIGGELFSVSNFKIESNLTLTRWMINSEGVVFTIPFSFFIIFNIIQKHQYSVCTAFKMESQHCFSTHSLNLLRTQRILNSLLLSPHLKSNLNTCLSYIAEIEEEKKEIHFLLLFIVFDDSKFVILLTLVNIFNHVHCTQILSVDNSHLHQGLLFPYLALTLTFNKNMIFRVQNTDFQEFQGSAGKTFSPIFRRMHLDYIFKEILTICSERERFNTSLQKRLAQLLAVDMQHAPANLSFKLHLFEYVDVLAQSLCILDSACAYWTVPVHQSLVESLLEKGWSNNRSFLGTSACQLKVEQVCFSVHVSLCITERLMTNTVFLPGSWPDEPHKTHFLHLAPYSTSACRLIPPPWNLLLEPSSQKSSLASPSPVQLTVSVGRKICTDIISHASQNLYVSEHMFTKEIEGWGFEKSTAPGQTKDHQMTILVKCSERLKQLVRVINNIQNHQSSLLKSGQTILIPLLFSKILPTPFNIPTRPHSSILFSFLSFSMVEVKITSYFRTLCSHTFHQLSSSIKFLTMFSDFSLCCFFSLVLFPVINSEFVQKIGSIEGRKQAFTLIHWQPGGTARRWFNGRKLTRSKEKTTRKVHP
ncbi:hypothetical protein VP01_311g2 [Puccinia sorghi]|uniref:Uncharacterized protein n=1 Tax=Puccinia sorghi TaxID=27349 RepID=A0A0L6V033_9BASI|nr:hypothetical protein VP01_311g2 [Puccinia sorghi]